MKKKFVVVLVAQSVLILLTLMYAFVQKAEAERQRRDAEIQQKIAKECREMIEKLENAG